MENDLRNPEGYPDPTPYEAMKPKYHGIKDYRPLVYICSPYSGNPPGNTEKARRYSRFAVDQGAIPIAPHLLLPQYMKEESERDLALLMDMVILDRCKELWVFGNFISAGMQAEIQRARKKRMKIRKFTEELKEES